MLLLFLAAATAQVPYGTVSTQMQQAIRVKMDRKLLDGASARYIWPKEKPDGGAYCGWVNAKNAYGAYIGWKPFFVIGAHANGETGHGQYLVISVELSTGDRVAETMCAQSGFDVSAPPSD